MLRFTLILGAFLLACSPLGAMATVVAPASVEQLADEASHVVVARVVRQWVVPTRGPRGEIYTRTALEVLEFVKGAGASVIEVQQLGGQLGDVRVEVPGNARLPVGGEVLVFLDVDEQTGVGYVVGLAQGVFHVARDTSGVRVARELGALAIYVVDGDAVWPPAPETLAELREAVRRRAAP